MQKRVFVLSTLLFIAILAVLAAEPARVALSVYLSEAAGSVPLPDRAAPHLPVEARHQDVADLRLLPNFDRSFTAKTKDAFLRGVDALDRDAGMLSDAAFEMAVSRLVALAGNAHTTVSKKQRAGNFGRVPLRFAWFADGLYVVRAKPPADGLLGRKVLSVDGRTVEQALADLRPYISGTAERARDDSPPLLESPALLQAVWPDTDGIHLTVGFEGGVTEQLAASPPAPDPFALQPVMVIGLGGAQDWQTVLAQAPQIPLSLRVPDHVAFSAPLEGDGFYIRINANDDDARGPLADQLAAIAATRPSGGCRRILLDLRFNDGGFEMTIMNFTRSLPRLLNARGELWILIGNNTFSAAIITAARAKYFVGSRAHVIGETVGDHSPFWATGGAPLVLRNAGIAIAHANFLEDWVHGCYSIRNCYPAQFLYGVAAGDLSPEVTVGWAFADYAAGRDTVLERALELSR